MSDLDEYEFSIFHRSHVVIIDSHVDFLLTNHLTSHRSACWTLSTPHRQPLCLAMTLEQWPPRSAPRKVLLAVHFIPDTSFFVVPRSEIDALLGELDSPAAVCFIFVVAGYVIQAKYSEKQAPPPRQKSVAIKGADMSDLDDVLSGTVKVLSFFFFFFVTQLTNAPSVRVFTIFLLSFMFSLFFFFPFRTRRYAWTYSSIDA